MLMTVLLANKQLANKQYDSPAYVGQQTPGCHILTLLYGNQQASFITLSSRVAAEGRGAARTRQSVIRMASPSSSSSRFPYPLCDSHHHVWQDGKEPFPYHPSQSAPPGLQDKGLAEDFIKYMDETGVQNSLIVQPILYLYDHSYVKSVLDKYPTRFKGMLNANPTLAATDAVDEIRRLHGQGFTSIRFNPYLWPNGEKMDKSVGRAIYEEAGKLKMPVGFMLFKGLHLHMPEVTTLLQDYPQTPAVIDHWGFFHQEGRDIEEAWQQLLSLARFPQVTVKVSAFFRVSSEPYPFSNLAPRLEELVKVYGSDRLMYGSDFPYVVNLGGGYKENPQCILKWKEEGLLPSLTERDYRNLFHETFAKVML